MDVPKRSLGENGVPKQELGNEEEELIMSEQLVIAIGTVTLALVALFQDFIRSWLKTPYLEVRTGSCTPFCRKLRLINKDDPSKQADGYALRIHIKNQKPIFRLKSRAEDVEIFALRLLKKQPDNSFQPYHDFEPRNLIWHHSFSPLTDISPEMERYCLVGRMCNPKERHNFPEFDNEMFPMDETCLRIDVDITRNTKDHIIPPGTYRIECSIGSSNTKAVKHTFEIYFSGDWFDEETIMYKNGISIILV